MIYVAATFLAMASVFMFVVSMWCVVQWIDEACYKPRMRRGK